MASYYGYAAVVGILATSKIDIMNTSESGQNALHIACKRGHPSVVKFLIREQYPLDEQKNDGSTALMVAISGKQDDVAKVLIEAGASLTLYSDDRLSAGKIKSRYMPPLF